MPFLAHMPNYVAKPARGGTYETYNSKQHLKFEELESPMGEFSCVFESMLVRTRAGTDYHGFAAVATLRVILLSTEISIRLVSMKRRIIPHDDQEHRHQEIVELAGRVVRDTRFKRTFVMGE